MQTIVVLMDYITCRCDEPQDKLYQERPPISDNPELGKFIEICFVPQYPMNEHLKEILFQHDGGTEIYYGKRKMV